MTRIPYYPFRQCFLQRVRQASGVHLTSVTTNNRLERRRAPVSHRAFARLVRGVVVHDVDGHSNKSALLPPTPDELESLALHSRVMQPRSASKRVQDAPVRSLRRRLAPQVIAELVARYRAGEDTPALSREYGISKTGLRELLQAAGVSMRRQAITPEDAQRAVRLIEGGMTIKQVVGQVGYSFGTIRRVLHEKRVAVRPSGTYLCLLCIKNYGG